MRQEIIDLYDDFTHRGLDRRVFMTRLAELAGGTAAAAALVPLLEASKAAAAVVPPDDARLATERVAIRTETGELRGYLARPTHAPARLPAVVVVHENRGLNVHIEDVARRAALAGFTALAPDYLSRAGGTPENEDRAREMISELAMDGVLADSGAAIEWLKARPDASGKAGMVGFCWGGGVVGRAASAVSSLDAGVVFYGRTPPAEAAARIKAPLLLHYAGLDERINADVPAFRAALDRAGVRYTAFMYEGANHAFLNDTSAARYNPQAAALAWERTVDFFKEHLA